MFLAGTCATNAPRPTRMLYLRSANALAPPSEKCLCSSPQAARATVRVSYSSQRDVTRTHSDNQMADIKRGFFKLQTNQATVLADTQYFPVIINKWIGEITPELYDLQWEFRDEHLIDRVSMIVFVQEVNDVDAPSATTRKYLADKSKADPRLQGPNVQVQLVMVVSNPLLRGVLTAVSWMTGQDTMPMEYQPNLQRGLEAAKSILDTHNVVCPDFDSNAYRFPDFKSMDDSEFIQIYKSS